MDAFLEHASRLLEGGESAVGEAAEWTILIGCGGIRLIAGAEWRLDRAAQETGAEMAYRVSARDGVVDVEGVHGLRRCHLRSTPKAEIFRQLLPDRRQYQLA